MARRNHSTITIFTGVTRSRSDVAPSGDVIYPKRATRMRQKRKKETTTVPFSQSKTPRKNFSFLPNDHWFTAAHSRYTEEANYHWEDFTMDFSHLLTDIRRRTSLDLSVPWFALNLAKKKSFSSLTTKVCHARKKPPPQRSNDSTTVVVVGVSEVSCKCSLFISLSLSPLVRPSVRCSLFSVARRAYLSRDDVLRSSTHTR